MDDQHIDVTETAPRCGWCGLVIAREDRESVPGRALCGTCTEILGDADWRALRARPDGAAESLPKLSDGARRKAAEG